MHPWNHIVNKSFQEFMGMVGVGHFHRMILHIHLPAARLITRYQNSAMKEKYAACVGAYTTTQNSASFWIGNSARILIKWHRRWRESSIGEFSPLATPHSICLGFQRRCLVGWPISLMDQIASTTLAIAHWNSRSPHWKMLAFNFVKADSLFRRWRR